MRRFSMAAGLVRAMVLSMATLVASSTAASEEGQFWRALQSGEAFAIMRHALAPGIGDPAIFDPEDCATQRNLSEEGRQQARELGETFRRNGITQADVYSSVWCRCAETAELLGLGPVTTLPALNSFFETRSRREMQTDALERWLADREEGAPLVLVTHQVNISALLGVFTSSGETLVVRREDDGDFEVIGSF